MNGGKGSVRTPDRPTTGQADLPPNVVEKMSDAFILLDREWRCVYANDKAVERFRSSRVELLGGILWETVPDVAGTVYERELRRAMEDRLAVCFEAYHAAYDIWTDVRAYPAGEGIAVYYIDVSKRKRAEEALRNELTRSRLLQEVAAAASRDLGMSQLAEAVLRRAHKPLGLVAGSMFAVDEEARDLRLLAFFGYSKDVIPSMRSIPLDGGSSTALAAVRERILTHGSGPPPPAALTQLEAARPEEARWVAVPLKAKGRVLGVLMLFLAGGCPFQAEETALFESIGLVVGQAMENARLFEREREAALLGEALADFDRAVHSTLEFEEIARRAVREGARTIGADTGTVVVREDGAFMVAQSYGFSEDIVGTTVPEEACKPALLALETLDVVAISHLPSDPRLPADSRAYQGIKSVIAAPLISRGKSVACLYYDYTTAGHHFVREETSFVSRIASSLSLALENAELYARQQRVADTLQEALLTMPGSIPGIVLAHIYRSAVQTARVGGDFYDVFEIERGRIGLLIGDVSGKGLEGAVLTSLVKNTVRAHALEGRRAPNDILASTNDVVFASSPGEVFVTIFFGVLELESGKLTYSNAGHPPPVSRDREGHVRLLGTNSPLLGAFPDVPFSSSETWLREGEVLLLYTDGVTEARQEGGELFGEERLYDLVRLPVASDPRGAVDSVYETILSFSGGELADDVALLAVRSEE